MFVSSSTKAGWLRIRSHVAFGVLTLAIGWMANYTYFNDMFPSSGLWRQLSRCSSLFK